MSCQQQTAPEDPYIFTETISLSSNAAKLQNISPLATKYISINRQQPQSHQIHQPVYSAPQIGNGKYRVVTKTVAAHHESSFKVPQKLNGQLLGNTSNSNHSTNSSKPLAVFTHQSFVPQQQPPPSYCSSIAKHGKNISSTVIGQSLSDQQTFLNTASQNTGINTVKPSTGKQLATKKKAPLKHDEVRPKKTKKLSQINDQNASKISIDTSAKGKRNVIAALMREWHAPGSYIFDYEDPSEMEPDLVSFTQKYWYPTAVSTSPPVLLLNSPCDKKKAPTSSAESSNQSTLQPPHNVSSGIEVVITREQRLLLKKDNLRRRTVQAWRAQSLRCTMQARKRLRVVQHLLKGLKTTKDELSTPQHPCEWPNCTSDAVELTEFCFQHIIHNREQKLFHPCTAKFSDNTQCRQPVYDLQHNLPLCREHAQKRDNYNRMVMEQKPKKPPRKKPKPSAMIRPNKRSKKKKKVLAQKQQVEQQPPKELHNFVIQQDNHQFIHHNSGNLLASGQSQHLTYSTDDMIMDKVLTTAPKVTYKHQNHPQGNKIVLDRSAIMVDNKYKSQHIKTPLATTQDLFTICESSYESSEDTGIGGLSESELMTSAHDIEQIPFEMEHQDELLEEHDLTNVLNQLPTHALEDFFSEAKSAFEPSQEEQEYLDRELENVDDQVKSLERMAADSTNFFGDFMNVADTLIDTIGEDDFHPNRRHMNEQEMYDQQQILNAATNLVNLSMQSPLMLHDQALQHPVHI